LSQPVLGCSKEKLLKSQVAGTQLDEISLLVHFKKEKNSFREFTFLKASSEVVRTVLRALFEATYCLHAPLVARTSGTGSGGLATRPTALLPPLHLSCNTTQPNNKQSI